MPTSRKQTTHYQDRLIKELEALPDKPRSKFTQEEDELIRKYYPAKGSSIAKVLGKTKLQISHRASVLGVRRNSW